MTEPMATPAPRTGPTRPTRPAELIPATIAVMAWLAGRWTGIHGESDLIEEQWSAPAGSGMVGMFRATREGSPRFYELLALDSDGDGLVFRFRHFDRALVGWEEREAPLVWDLVELATERAVFLKRGEQRWMTYRRDGEGGLAVYFEGPDGQHADEDEFRFVRA